MTFSRIVPALLFTGVVIAGGACSSSSNSSAKDAGSGGSGSGGATTGTGGAGGASATGGAGGSSSDAGPTDTGADVATDVAGDGGGLTATQMRGQYLTSLLGCVNCHTPKLTGGALDTANLFAGVDCTADASGNCLSTPNLTPDATGIMSLTDQQLKDAFQKGMRPAAAADAGAATFLFANMPYYQYANLSADDASAIVAYLRQLVPVVHKVKDNAGTSATPPTAAQWTPADPTMLPAPGATAPADAANGKYLATLMCATCHTVNTAATAPLHIDETKGFQGGKTSSITGDGGTMMFQSANLTPDMTGIMGWMVSDVVTAIKMAKDKMGKTLCSPMRANATITDADATAVADYLLSLPAVANPAVMACMARM
ncbi:MAG TPA: c-type cytochrome [Polyangia bacterium]|jgi:mono/diheme cytochrome c family protein|nr:c-type cytochrome [Polyangia bacterium]